MLIRYALRTCARKALLDNTVVGKHVSDSRIGAIDIAADGELQVDGRHPFIDVFTDDSDFAAEDSHGPMDLHRSGTIGLVFESAIATPMAEVNQETGEAVVDCGTAVLPATDDHFELLLDVIDRQITQALSDPANEWAELLRRLILRVDQVQRRRAAREEDGTRRAARQMRLVCRVLPDPTTGAPLSAISVWRDLRTKIEAEIPEALQVYDAMLGTPGDEFTLDHIQRHSGRSSIAMTALGLAPADPDNPDATWQGYEVEKVEE